MANLQHRAKDALVSIGKQYPDLHGIVDGMALTSSSRRNEWPEHVLLPNWAWKGIAGHLLGLSGAQLKDPKALNRLTALSKSIKTLGTWAKTQGIYRVDPDIYAELVESEFDGEIPVQLLQHLPEWSIYIETPGLMLFDSTHIAGLWVTSDYRETSGASAEACLAITPDLVVSSQLQGAMEARSISSARLLGGLEFVLPLRPGGRLSDAMDSLRESYSEIMGGITSGANLGEYLELENALRGMLSAAISLTLYIATQNDVRASNAGEGLPANPTPKKTKGGMRLFPPSSTKTWDVGVRMGNALRSARAQAEDAGAGSGSSVRPHVRRAHWHGFRVGKAKDEQGNQIPAAKRDMQVKWLPSIAINSTGSDADMPAVIHRV